MALPQQRWRIMPSQPQLAQAIAAQNQLTPLFAQVLINRGINTIELAQSFLAKELVALPDPKSEYLDLQKCVDILMQMQATGGWVAICGDYDVDGMTSTALLLRTFASLGIQARYEIPSRMTEGYGINDRMVKDLHAAGVGLIITVDNGISAYGAIALAKELGMYVIITDHHELPDRLPPADAILNPKQISPASPYYTIAGVGVAYLLGLELANQLESQAQLEPMLLELFTLGTIADLASLTGINRQLVQRGLGLLAKSQIPGIQALKQVAGIGDRTKQLKPESIGFSLGPRINAIGRIGDPTTVIELLTTEDEGIALERAMQCEQVNRKRQELCSEIEQEAILMVLSQIQTQDLDLLRDRVLVLVCDHWHHGVIGIVASRLVERFGAPVFMCSAEEDGNIRSSARGTPEFNVFDALEFCHDLLHKFGGHAAAGGFSTSTDNFLALRERLREFARLHLTPEQICPAIAIDAEIPWIDVSLDLYLEMERLQPCGIGNREPIFYSMNGQIQSQKRFGKKQEHLSLVIDRGDGRKLNAIAWRWADYYPLPKCLDLAYKINLKTEYDQSYLQLELVGARLPLSSLSALLSDKWNPILEYQTAPPIAFTPKFQHLCLDAISEIPQPILLYGHGYDKSKFTDLGAELDCDRPTRSYATLVLWNLPPSITHLRWLIALVKPSQIYLHKAIPPIPSLQELEVKVMDLIGMPKLNLMELSQQWWVSPSVIVAMLRELGYGCPEFAPTNSVAIALQGQQRWYEFRIEQLDSYLKNSQFEFPRV